jgi:membrane-associated phospholipid phosphatase
LEKFISIYQRLSYYLNLLLVFITAGAILLSTIPKGNLELWINRHNNPLFDQFFFYVTYIGNGWMYVAFILIVFFTKRKYFWMSACAGILCLIFSSCMKFLVFTKETRPPGFFEDSLMLHFVKGAPVLYANSFPSGHTLSAFSMFCILSFMVEKKAWQILFFLIALTVGLSRIYLLAHFKEDVYAGAIIGSAVSLFIIYIFDRFIPGGDLIKMRSIKVKVPNE